MEPLIPKTKAVSVFLPYRKTIDSFEFFLQKRDRNTPTDTDVFSMFGGGVEAGENPLEALVRELSEELEYTPKNPLYFTETGRANTTFHVFIEEVPVGFEDSVKVHEGEYGRFLTTHEILFSTKVALISQLIINDVSRYLTDKDSIQE